MRSTERHPSPNRRGLIIVTTLAIAYVASHFFRASNVTIGLDLMRDLSIGPEALGALTGAFFFGFAATQIPCGFLFDRFGPRRSLVGMLILATSGGIIFTLAPTWPLLLTGRVLMGAGFGVMLIGSMVVISRWFPPDSFSTLAAMVMSIGLLGNLAATTPLAWATQAIGWRSVFGTAVVCAIRFVLHVNYGMTRATRGSTRRRAGPVVDADVSRECWRFVHLVSNASF